MVEDSSDCCSQLESRLIEILEDSLYTAYAEFGRKFDSIFLPLIKQYGGDEEKLVQFRKRCAKMVQDIIAQELEDKLDTQEVQDKWAQITSIDKSLEENKLFLQEIKPLKGEYLCGLQKIKAKLSESREGGKKKLINEAKLLNIVEMLKANSQMSEKLQAMSVCDEDSLT